MQKLVDIAERVVRLMSRGAVDFLALKGIFGEV